MQQVAQKPRQKFCGKKTAKKRKTHPVWAKKGETGCVLGAGGDGNGCEQVRTDRKDRKARRNSWDGLVSAAASVGPGRSPSGCRPPRHAPQAGLRAHLVAKSYRTLTKKSGTAQAIPDFLAGAEGLEPSARGFGVDVGKRTGGTGEGQCCPVLPNKSQKSGAGLVLTPDFAAIRLSFGLRIDSRLAGKILDNLSIGKDDLSFAIGGNVLVMGD